MPRAVAAGMSRVSSPTPLRMINCRFGSRSRRSAVIEALATSTQCASCRASARSAWLAARLTITRPPAGSMIERSISKAAGSRASVCTTVNCASVMDLALVRIDEVFLARCAPAIGRYGVQLQRLCQGHLFRIAARESRLQLRRDARAQLLLRLGPDLLQ